jgi:hypothetical protein
LLSDDAVLLEQVVLVDSREQVAGQIIGPDLPSLAES